MLTYKVVVLDGFSLFCDWENIHLRENGGIDLAKLKDELEEHLKLQVSPSKDKNS